MLTSGFVVVRTRRFTLSLAAVPMVIAVISPPATTATSLVPSADEATVCHWRLLSRAVQFVPLSLEV